MRCPFFIASAGPTTIIAALALMAIFTKISIEGQRGAAHIEGGHTMATTKKATAEHIALENAMIAAGGVLDASATFVDTAKAAAKAIWESFKAKPRNGEALAEQIKAAKERNADLKEKYQGKRWENTWNDVANFLHCMLRPNTKITFGKTSPEVIKAADESRIAQVRALARQIRINEGTARNVAPRHNTPKPVDPTAASQAEFHVNLESVRSLVDRVLALDSGVGLLEECLKAHGWLVVPSEAKRAELEAVKAALEAKRKAAAEAKAASAALKAKAARRSAKARSK